jgi:OmpA-OmpF porin, OOP family
MKKLKAVLAMAGLSAALGFAGSAAAQSLSSVYIGGTVGQAELKDACQGLASCDEKDTAWRILGGYQFNRNFAAEIGYHNLGEASAPAGATKGNVWELVGIGSYPIANQFSVYGKLGFYRGELEAPSAKETNTDFTYGVGLQYDIARNVGVRGEWQRYSKMGGGAVVETDVDVLSVGVVYRFQ